MNTTLLGFRGRGNGSPKCSKCGCPYRADRCPRCLTGEQLKTRNEKYVKEPPPALEPTSALPGSEEKIAVMAARFAAGLGIFHPQDARGYGGPCIRGKGLGQGRY